MAALTTPDPPLRVQLTMGTWLLVRPLDIICGLPVQIVEDLPDPDATAAVVYYE